MSKSSRTWGPFSGGQLTTILVTLVIGVVMVPSTVWAVDAFTNVAIEDPVSGKKAAVDTAHRLQVNGAVSARMGSPFLPFAFNEDVVGSPTRMVGPTIYAINLTAIAVAPKNGQTLTGDFYFYVGSQPSTDATCNSSSITYTLYHVPGIQSSPVFVQSFPTPLVIPRPATGQKTCLYAYTPGTWTVNGSGFLGT